MTSKRWERFIRTMDWLLRVFGIISFIAVSLVYLDVRENARETNRQAECNALINDAQDNRAKNLDGDLTRERNASRRADDALSALVTALLATPPASAEERHRLFVELSVSLRAQTQTRIAADKARADNPPVSDLGIKC